jgi:hypothetical protein
MTESDETAILMLRESGYEVYTNGIFHNAVHGGASVTVEFIPWKKIRMISIGGANQIYMRLWSAGELSDTYLDLKQNADVVKVYTYLSSRFWDICVNGNE